MEEIMSTDEDVKEAREQWIKSAIRILADIFQSSFLTYIFTPFTFRRPKDLTLKEFLSIVFSTENELKTNIIGHMLRAGITQAEIDEIFALFVEEKTPACDCAHCIIHRQPTLK